MKVLSQKSLGVGVISTLLITSISSFAVASTDQTMTDSTSLGQTSASNLAPNFDPWLQKPILGYLFNTQDAKLQNDVTSLQQTLNLSDEQMAALKQASSLESFVVGEVKRDSDNTLATKSNFTEKVQAVKDLGYNGKVSQALMNTDVTVKQVLKDKYPDFRKWLYNWWNNERSYRNQNVIQPTTVAGGGSGTYYQIYATQYAANTTYEVSLPDKYLKFSYYGNSTPTNYSGQYSVTVQRNGTYTTQYVKEVGPWNENDNYWDVYYDRREFFDLAQYTPEAYAAFENNYNNGLDEFGRTVLTPAGIDLSPAVATILGMGSGVSAYVTVNFVGLP